MLAVLHIQLISYSVYSLVKRPFYKFTLVGSVLTLSALMFDFLLTSGKGPGDSFVKSDRLCFAPIFLFSPKYHLSFSSFFTGSVINKICR